ncbi:hypothetical protein Adeh_1895 [Anaeromyxobacter dehalogenans 2CP-C]|uniref:Uncharacterized protein n=1 Tax=Anaeromyxobacter dehalogenans (strain 2CP-C) TaxID=290397 RepID=Q2IJ38_ANADE|nr:hypothetical protein Adeh_1895 [Anaeromyxobacter dehalogenans 2CP-C]
MADRDRVGQRGEPLALQLLLDPPGLGQLAAGERQRLAGAGEALERALLLRLADEALHEGLVALALPAPRHAGSMAPRARGRKRYTPPRYV